jgi:hypothetical protein
MDKLKIHLGKTAILFVSGQSWSINFEYIFFSQNCRGGTFTFFSLSERKEKKSFYFPFFRKEKFLLPFFSGKKRKVPPLKVSFTANVWRIRTDTNREPAFSWQICLSTIKEKSAFILSVIYIMPSV